MGDPVINAQAIVSTNPIEVEDVSTNNSVQKSEGEVALSLTTLPRELDGQNIPHSQLTMSEANVQMEGLATDSLLLVTNTETSLSHAELPLSSQVNVRILDDKPKVVTSPQKSFLTKYSNFENSLKNCPQNVVLTYGSDGKVIPLTRMQRFIAALSSRLFGFFFPTAKAGMLQLRKEITDMLPAWGGIAQRYQDYIENMPLTRGNMQRLLQALTMATEEHLAGMEQATFDLHGSVSAKGRAVYSAEFNKLLEEDIIPRKQLQTEVRVDGQGSETLGNLFGLEQRYETLAVSLDGQVVLDFHRQVLDINGQEFVNWEKGSYLDQKLATAIAQDQKARQAYEPMPKEAFLSKAFIQKLKDEFGASNEEITVLSYLISQRASFFIAKMFGSGYFGLPEGTAPFNVGSRFSITQTDNGGYRIMAYYELKNPSYLVIANEKETKMYLYEQTKSRQDFVNVSVALDFKMEEGKPVVMLADEGIKYDIRLTGTEGGEWK